MPSTRRSNASWTPFVGSTFAAAGFWPKAEHTMIRRITIPNKVLFIMPLAENYQIFSHWLSIAALSRIDERDGLHDLVVSGSYKRKKAHNIVAEAARYDFCVATGHRLIVPGFNCPSIREKLLG